MSKTFVWILKISLVIFMYFFGFIMFDILPETISLTLDGATGANVVWPKFYAILLMPTLTLGIVIVYPLLMSIFPEKLKYKLDITPFEVFHFGILFFLTYLHLVIFYIAFNPIKSFTFFILCGLGVLFVLLGRYLCQVNPACFLGIKTAWTLNNEKIWRATQNVASWCFILAGLIILLTAYANWQSVIITGLAISACAVIPWGYSFLAAKKNL